MRSSPVPGRVGGGTLRRWAGVIATAMLALSAGRASAVAPARPHPEQRAPSYPAVTTSAYETNADPGRVWRQGCGAGRAAKSGIVILDWGRPAYRHGYGTIDFGGHFDQNAAIQRAMKAFAVGFAHCLPKRSRARISLARGTNNSCSNQDPVCCPHRCRHQPPSFALAGRFWAKRVGALESFLKAKGLSSHIRASAADDAEPAWDPAYRNTFRFLKGYADMFGYTYAMWDFGSLDPGYWSPRQEYMVAYGLKPNVPVPEIFGAINAVQWEQLDQWAVSHTGRQMRIYGVVTQWARGSKCGFKPRQGYDAMLSQLQSDPRTWQPSIAALTNLACKPPARRR